MNVMSVIGLGLIAAMLCILLRQVRPELALALSLAAGVVILLAVFTDLAGILERIRDMAAKASVPSGYVQVLFKALGICFITQLACDTCKDAGESAISAKVEMAGKLAVLVVSLPLFEQVLTVVQTLLTG